MAPYHRIKRWNGEYFESSDLAWIGLVIHVGHGGRNCPSYNNPQSSQNMTISRIDLKTMDDEWADEEVDGGQEEALPLYGAEEINEALPESQVRSGSSQDTPDRRGHIDGNLLVSDTMVQMPGNCRCAHSTVTDEFIFSFH